jgi:hypothetical protein
MKFTITKETRKIIQAAKEASNMAGREAKALGLSVRIIEKGIIYDVDAEGRKAVVAVLPAQDKAYTRFKKGTILRLSNG